MKIALLLAYFFFQASEFALAWLNLNFLKRHGTEVPPGFEECLTRETLQKAAAYTIESNRLKLVETMFCTMLVVLFLFCGVLEPFDRWVTSLSDSFILQGILFFTLLQLTQAFLDIPFSLYWNFSLENRYGFNTMTPAIWANDFLKSTLLSLLLISLLVAGAFKLILVTPQGWWLWVWLFLTLVSLSLIYLPPCVIEPLFSKFEPLHSEILKKEIQSLMGLAGLEVRRVLQVDASRRSKHSNAYFTGIGKVKRIVLYDTLLERLNSQEILAVLAHEAGHWKAHHLLKRLIATETIALLSCYASSYLLREGSLPALFGMEMVSFPAQLVLLGFLFSILLAVFSPLGNVLSRRQERQADHYASTLSETPDALASALVKMSRDNLSNLHPHPLYAAIYYLHPPVVERVRTLSSLKHEDTIASTTCKNSTVST
ncbi:MAG: M48 family metallopeptidase [Geobacteraceae bacterium]|nr:M48 family metallopeptidase [Geobacteraceae bacterium]